MKNKLCIIAIIISSALFAGCGDNADNSQKLNSSEILIQIESIIKSDMNDDDKIYEIRNALDSHLTPSVSENDFKELFEKINDNFIKISNYSLSDDGKTLKEDFKAHQEAFDLILNSIMSLQQYVENDENISSDTTYEMYKKGEEILNNIQKFALDINFDLNSSN